MKFRSYEQHQIMLLPESIEDLIPENHLVRAIDIVVEQLNLDQLYNSYGEEGQPAYHPKMLIKILLYGYATNIRSSRKLSEKLDSDVFYMYLAGMQMPDFRTISDFRKNKKEYLCEVFKEVLGICRQIGLVSLGHIAIDGTKIEANSSRKMMKDKEDILKIEANIERQVKSLLDSSEKFDEQEDEKYGKQKRGDELPDELSKEEKFLEKIKAAKKYLEENKLKRVSITDPDTRIMKTGGGTNICYNAQAAVDSANQIIVACKVSNAENDHYNFIPVYEEVIKNTGEMPKEVSADAGYHSGKTYLYLEENNIDGYIPDCKFTAQTDKKGNEVIGPFDRRRFSYSSEKDNYVCPAGKEMVFSKNSSRNGVKFRIYKGTNCLKCESREECIEKSTANYRQIQIYENDKFKTEMRMKLLSKEGRKKYKKRMVTIEPVFAHIKRVMGFREFLLRGIDKVSCELNLICTAYNIKKLSKHLNFSTV
jgi:transposase